MNNPPKDLPALRDLIRQLQAPPQVARAASTRGAVLAFYRSVPRSRSSGCEEGAAKSSRLDLMADRLKQTSIHSGSSTSRQEWVLSTRHGKIDMNRRTALMGVLNVTPDSFSDGGRYFDAAKAVAQGLKLAREGADIIDIGGESTRPGAQPVSAEKEIERVVPVVRGLRGALSIPLSVDTYKAQVAQAALDEGADMINDISALRLDPAMAALAVREKVPVVLMHMQGTPRTMQASPYYRDVVAEVKEFLQDRIRSALDEGLSPQQIVVDPGIGFGKTLEHNLELLRGLSALTSLGQPVLVGPSRKTFIGKILGAGPEQRLEGSLAAAVAAVLAGANIVRMHDVKEARQALRIADAIRYGASEGRG